MDEDESVHLNFSTESRFTWLEKVLNNEYEVPYAHLIEASLSGNQNKTHMMKHMFRWDINDEKRKRQKPLHKYVHNISEITLRPLEIRTFWVSFDESPIFNEKIYTKKYTCKKPELPPVVKNQTIENPTVNTTTPSTPPTTIVARFHALICRAELMNVAYSVLGILILIVL
jgi:hypothetical protein